jgi:hypothetical protein
MIGVADVDAQRDPEQLAAEMVLEPGADDIMLNYQSTSFHDAAYLRQLLHLRPAPEFEAWLQRTGVLDAANALLPISPQHRLLASIYG